MKYNLAEMICSKPEDAAFRIAIEEVRVSGSNTYTFGGLDYLSDKFGNVLSDSGINEGDVVGVILPASAAFVVAHFAVLKLGAIVAPFSLDLEIDLLEQLIGLSHARALIIDEGSYQKFEERLHKLKDVEIFIASDCVSKNDFGAVGRGFWYEINFADADFKIPQTDGTTPAYIFFEQDVNNLLTNTLRNHSSMLSSPSITNGLNVTQIEQALLLHNPNDWGANVFMLENCLRTLFAGEQIRTIDETSLDENKSG